MLTVIAGTVSLCTWQAQRHIATSRRFLVLSVVAGKEARRVERRDSGAAERNPEGHLETYVHQILQQDRVRRF